MLMLNYDNWDFTFDGTLREFELSETYKYWTPYLNIGSVDGNVAAEMQLEGNVMDIFAMNISGVATATNFAITTPTGGKVLLADRLEVGVEEVNIDAERYILSSLVASGYSSEMLFNKDGSTNFDILFYNDPTITIESTTTEEGENLYDVKERVTVTTTTEEETSFDDMVIKIGHVDLKGGEFLYSDDTMHRTFEYQLRDINTPERLLMTRQIADTVDEAMADLPEELRTAIQLRELEGLSYEEIAGIMGCPIGTVRSRIFRAREAIAEHLRPLLDTTPDKRW